MKSSATLLLRRHGKVLQASPAPLRPSLIRSSVPTTSPDSPGHRRRRRTERRRGDARRERAALKTTTISLRHSPPLPLLLLSPASSSRLSFVASSREPTPSNMSRAPSRRERRRSGSTPGQVSSIERRSIRRRKDSGQRFSSLSTSSSHLSFCCSESPKQNKRRRR